MQGVLVRTGKYRPGDENKLPSGTQGHRQWTAFPVKSTSIWILDDCDVIANEGHKSPSVKWTVDWILDACDIIADE
ncbi:hypothetical protein MAR_021262, partial [Mya arenaria]